MIATPNDGIYVAHPDGLVELLVEDPTGELLSRPTNVALHDRRLYISNLGGWHIASIPTDLKPGPVFYPATTSSLIAATLGWTSI